MGAALPFILKTNVFPLSYNDPPWRISCFSRGRVQVRQSTSGHVGARRNGGPLPPTPINPYKKGYRVQVLLNTRKSAGISVVDRYTSSKRGFKTPFKLNLFFGTITWPCLCTCFVYLFVLFFQIVIPYIGPSRCRF